MMDHFPNAGVPLLALAALLVLGSCGGSSEPTALAGAACPAALEADGSIVFPAVATSALTARYVLTPAPTAEAPARYRATVSAASVASTCAGLFAPGPGSRLNAANVGRMGQALTVSLVQAESGADGAPVFDAVSGTARAGVLDGFVGGSLPIADASVTVLGADGAVLMTGSTNAYGAIIAPLGDAALPDEFRVVATGGTLNGAPFSGSLKADVSEYSRMYSPVITLTPVTTLLVAYRAAHPELGAGQAGAALRDFLGLPPDVEVDSDHESSDGYLDAEAFYTQAAAAGGMEVFVPALIARWDSGVEHRFAPMEKDRAGDTYLEKVVLRRGDALPPDGVQVVKSASVAFSIAGKLWESYQSGKTKEFQSDTIQALQTIQREVSELKSQLVDVRLGLAEAKYKIAKQPLIEYESRLSSAMDALVLLATKPNDPPEVRAPRIARIKSVTDARSQNYISDGFHVTFRTAMIGDHIDKGMLGLYREAALLRSQTDRHPDTKRRTKDRKFYTYLDSWKMWDHLRYYQNLQTMAYFFWSEYYASPQPITDTNKTGSPRTDELVTLQNRIRALEADQNAQMPERVLPANAYIDTENISYEEGASGTDFRRNPLLWYVSAIVGSQCSGENDSITFDSRNESVQGAIAARMECFNKPGNVGGIGKFRLPTFWEWERFTQTTGNPSRNVGAWLVERGIRFGPDLNKAEFFYATIGNNCDDATVKGKYTVTCNSLLFRAKPKFFFTNRSSEMPLAFVCPAANRPCISTPRSFWESETGGPGNWEPFIRFNKQHSPGNWREAGGKGFVLPVRDTTDTEFY